MWPVGAINVYLATINGDRFIAYMFEEEQAARDYCDGEPHAIAGGRFVLKSVPDDIYYVRGAGMGDRPDDEVSWSRLLDDQAFVDAARSIGTAGAPSGA